MEKNIAIASAKMVVAECDQFIADFLPMIHAIRKQMEETVFRVEVIKLHAKNIIESEGGNEGGIHQTKSGGSSNDGAATANVAASVGRTPSPRASVNREQRKAGKLVLSLSQGKG